VQQEIDMLTSYVQKHVIRKYKIYFTQGVKVIFENVIFFFLLLSIVLKCNIFSLIYSLLMSHYVWTERKYKSFLICIYVIGVCFFL
jgi:hypothetical protein